MKIKLLAVLVLTVVGLAVSAPLFAHHSNAS